MTLTKAYSHEWLPHYIREWKEEDYGPILGYGDESYDCPLKFLRSPEVDWTIILHQLLPSLAIKKSCSSMIYLRWKKGVGVGFSVDAEILSLRENISPVVIGHIMVCFVAPHDLTNGHLTEKWEAFMGLRLLGG